MEYVQYGDLGQYVTQHWAEAKTEVKWIIVQILEGLGVLHERDICHRNMKPQVRHHSGLEIQLTVL